MRYLKRRFGRERENPERAGVSVLQDFLNDISIVFLLAEARARKNLLIVASPQRENAQWSDGKLNYTQMIKAKDDQIKVMLTVSSEKVVMKGSFQDKEEEVVILRRERQVEGGSTRFLGLDLEVVLSALNPFQKKSSLR